MKLELRIRSKKVGLLLLIVLLGLASRVLIGLYHEARAAVSSQWRSHLVYLPVGYGRIDERLTGLVLSEQPDFLIEDVVLLADDIVLLLQLPQSNRLTTFHSLPAKESLTCLFNGRASTSVTGLDYSRGRALVRCSLPARSSLSHANNAHAHAGGAGSDHVGHSLPSLPDDVISVCLRSGSKVLAGLCNEVSRMKVWSFLVFEIWVTSQDVVLFAKGINNRQGHNASPDDLVCVYGVDDAGGPQVETTVTQSSQEVFRCAHPSPEKRRSLYGQPVTLKWKQELVLPTLVYYEATSMTPLHGTAGDHPAAPAMEICICTMIYNVAKFLPEWGTFHSQVGFDRFILYDNNSEDELEEALAWLAARQLQVDRYPWPWPKTQEAGFSHCALAVRHACEWVSFSDVDEFLFPAAYLPPSGITTPIRQLIAANIHLQPQSPPATPALINGGPAQVLVPPAAEIRQLSIGQISMRCRDFGPSSLTQHPAEGVTQGYVCRSNREERHKSMVKLEAIADNLHNVVHHFSILPAYTTITTLPDQAVVNHYKFQAWPEFRQKFRRRVSAYVADWKESRNLGSRDRTPGLGASVEKPMDWETSFCDVSDTALRDYCRRNFALNVSGTLTFAWRLRGSTVAAAKRGTTLL